MWSGARRCAGITLLVAITIVLAGCSQTKLFYGFLDNWIRWQVEDYVDLTKSQDQLITAASKDFHQWHRSNELPRYAQFLEEIEKTLSLPGLTIEQIEPHLQFGETLWMTSAKELQPAARELFASLSQEQVEHMLAQIDKEKRKREKAAEKLSAEDAFEKLIKARRKNIEQFVGKLSTEQIEHIRQWAKERSDLTEFYESQYQQWRDDFATELNNDRTAAVTLDKLVALTFEQPEVTDPAIAAKIEKNRQLALTAYINIHASLTPKQRQKLSDRLSGYREDALELAGID